MNLVNSPVRFSLHPNGDIQDYKTGMVHKLTDGEHLDDGVFTWGLRRLRTLLGLGRHPEDAIIGPTRQRHGNNAAYIDYVDGHEAAQSEARVEAGIGSGAPGESPAPAAPPAETASGSAAAAAAVAKLPLQAGTNTDPAAGTNNGSTPGDDLAGSGDAAVAQGLSGAPAGALLTDEPGDAPTGSDVPPDAPVIDEPPTEASNVASNDGAKEGTS